MIHYDEKKNKTSLGVKPPSIGLIPSKEMNSPKYRNTEMPKPIGLSQIPTIMVLYDEIRYKKLLCQDPLPKCYPPFIQKLHLNT